jgi:hypothetical protein
LKANSRYYGANATRNEPVTRLNSGDVCAAHHLKAELKRADVTYEELAERLKAHGFTETQGQHFQQTGASISNRFILSGMPSGAGASWRTVGGPFSSLWKR